MLSVALDAESHLVKVYHGLDAVHVGNVAVAPATVKTGPDVHRMVKIYKLAQSIDAHPRHRIPVIVILRQLFDLGMMDDDPFMAQHARLDGRHSRPGRMQGARVTEHATEILGGDMKAVAEGDGLFRADL
jgi:hypothetical protein